MFRFNFQNSLHNIGKENDSVTKINSQDEVIVKPFSVNFINDNSIKLIRNISSINYEEREWDGFVKMKYLHRSGKELSEEESDLIPYELSEEKSDFIPNVYEGGYKIWECTWDLLLYLKEKKYSFKNCRVIDLGCGSGILGIAASLLGASVVTFQDYNEDVIKRWTIPNVILNSENIEDESAKEILNSKFKFYSGDWGEFAKNLSSMEERNFDYILTSETIYNTKNYTKLIDVFEKFLKTSGIILLASKSYYFGVGGSTFEFINALSKTSFQTSSTVCHIEGVQREILVIKKS